MNIWEWDMCLKHKMNRRVKIKKNLIGFENKFGFSQNRLDLWTSIESTEHLKYKSNTYLLDEFRVEQISANNLRSRFGFTCTNTIIL